MRYNPSLEGILEHIANLTNLLKLIKNMLKWLKSSLKGLVS